MVNWDETAKFRLLLAVIKISDMGTPNYAKVAEDLGEGFTSESVRQQYQKIKKALVSEGISTADGDNATGPAAKTPKKIVDGDATTVPAKTPKKAAAPKTPNTKGSGKRTKAVATEGDENDDDEEKASPVKKSRKTPAAKKRTPAKSKKVLSEEKVKAEDEEVKAEDGDDHDGESAAAVREVEAEAHGDDEA